MEQPRTTSLLVTWPPALPCPRSSSHRSRPSVSTHEQTNLLQYKIYQSVRVCPRRLGGSFHACPFVSSSWRILNLLWHHYKASPVCIPWNLSRSARKTKLSLILAHYVLSTAQCTQRTKRKPPRQVALRGKLSSVLVLVASSGPRNVNQRVVIFHLPTWTWPEYIANSQHWLLFAFEFHYFLGTRVD